MQAVRELRHEVIDSTSTEARRVIGSGGAGEGAFLVVARTQTGGRGQLGRSWSSPKGGLWCTLAWPGAGVALDGLGLRVGLACVRTVDAALKRLGNESGVTLKWPNDVQVAGKKVCGVLTECVTGRGERWVLAGVGINANFAVTDLPQGVATRATTLRDQTGRECDLEAMLSDLAAHLGQALGAPGLSGALLQEARSRLDGVGCETEMRSGDATVRGVLLGLNDDGLPLVRTENGVVIARSASLESPEPAMRPSGPDRSS